MDNETQTRMFKFANPLSAEARYCCTWRGGGFRDEFKEFYESMMGKWYRVPGLLATSIGIRRALGFLARADQAHPRILWCILVKNALFLPCQLFEVSRAVCICLSGFVPLTIFITIVYNLSIFFYNREASLSITL